MIAQKHNFLQATTKELQKKIEYDKIYLDLKIRLCGYGGIGRRAGFRFQSERVQVQLLLSAPNILESKSFYGEIL